MLEKGSRATKKTVSLIWCLLDVMWIQEKCLDKVKQVHVHQDPIFQRQKGIVGVGESGGTIVDNASFMQVFPLSTLTWKGRLFSPIRPFISLSLVGTSILVFR